MSTQRLEWRILYPWSGEGPDGQPLTITAEDIAAVAAETTRYLADGGVIPVLSGHVDPDRWRDDPAYAASVIEGAQGKVVGVTARGDGLYAEVEVGEEFAAKAVGGEISNSPGISHKRANSGEYGPVVDHLAATITPYQTDLGAARPLLEALRSGYAMQFEGGRARFTALPRPGFGAKVLEAAKKFWMGQFQDEGTTEVQTLIFAKERFTVAQAKAWASEHGFHVGKVDETEDSIRLRQADPDAFAAGSFGTIQLTTGVQAVVGRPLNNEADTPPEEEDGMSDTKLAELEAQVNDLRKQLEALTGERDAAVKELEALKAEAKKQAEAQLEADQKAAVESAQKLVEAGTLSPAFVKEQGLESVDTLRERYGAGPEGVKAVNALVGAFGDVKPAGPVLKLETVSGGPVNIAEEAAKKIASEGREKGLSVAEQMRRYDAEIGGAQ